MKSGIVMLRRMQTELKSSDLIDKLQWLEAGKNYDQSDQEYKLKMYFDPKPTHFVFLKRCSSPDTFILFILHVTVNGNFEAFVCPR